MEGQNISISGSGRVSGGEYGQVRISGSGKVDGDVTAQEIRVSGSGRFQGEVKAKEITVSGAGKFTSRVEADVLVTSGSCGIDGDAEVKELRSSGAQRIGGSFHGHYVRVSGVLHVARDLEADVFTSSGRFEIGGLLSADRVEVKLVGDSRAREIGGENIDIRASSGLSFGFSLARGFRFGLGIGTLTVGEVEGDRVHLEATTADVVRGKVVHVGPGCRIGRVEYSESLEVHPEAEVGERIKR
ncbi:MAG: polymer-forming cytoskeletal protein [Candidatus Bipolaricaulota bacterium]|nr:polymer-forming cytoskeletal protein [Candidatus Bipolaricaulota bacterium]